MAVKNILEYGTPSLRQPSKEVHKVSKKVKEIVNDLLDTMYAKNGVGLAAPQVGENYRIFVIDVSSGDEPLNPVVFINPKIIKKSGAFISNEGCLSFPEVYADVRRYSNVMVKALNIDGKPFITEATGETLLVKALQHEFDHLDGILFIDHVRNRFEIEESLKKHHLPSLEIDKLVQEDELEQEIEKKLANIKK